MVLILIVGAKGGLGTTMLAQHLGKAAGAIPLDAADGRLAADAGTAVLDLGLTPQWTASRRSRAIAPIIQTRQPLLWTPACSVWAAPVTAFVRDLAAVGHIVADGGITPPATLADLASAILIVSADTPVAQWHEQRLKQQWPAAHAIIGDLKAAAPTLATQLLGHPIRPSWQSKIQRFLPKRRFATESQ